MRFFKVGLFLIFLIFTFILRAHNYERVPTSNHLDEMLYAWSGMYIIEEGVPVSWSTLDYPKRAEFFKGNISYKGGEPEASVTLYKPWLDEPPLFSLLVGYFAHINGANKTEFVPSSFIRIPMVFIGTMVSIFVFLIAKKLFDYKTGILSMFFYGITPTFLFGSRTAMPENLIALCFVAIIWLILKYKEKLNFWNLVPIPLLVGIAGLSKPTGFFLLPFAIFVTLWLTIKKISTKQIIKSVSYLIITTLPFIIYYFWYSYNLDSEIFKTIFKIQSNRPVGFSGFLWLLISPSFDTAIFKDGWYVFSIVFALYLLVKPKNKFNTKFLSLTFIFWTMVTMFTGGEGDLMAWYRFPVFPILAIISVIGIMHLYKLNNIFSTFIFFGLLLTSRYLLTTPFNQNIKPENYKIWFVIVMIPALLSFIFKIKFFQKLNKLVALGIISVGIFLNLTLIYRYYDLKCEAKTCPMVPSTGLSEIRLPYIWRFFTFKFSSY